MNHKYHVLEWKAADIDTFRRLPNLSFAVFNFEKPMLGHYYLSVSGFDIHGNLLGTSPIEKYSDATEPDLDNAYPGGLFFVKMDDITSNPPAATKTLYFAPKPYEATGGTTKYVCYNIYDLAPIDRSFDRMVAVGSINPSPPRNSGSMGHFP